MRRKRKSPRSSLNICFVEDYIPRRGGGEWGGEGLNSYVCVQKFAFNRTYLMSSCFGSRIWDDGRWMFVCLPTVVLPEEGGGIICPLCWSMCGCLILANGEFGAPWGGRGGCFLACMNECLWVVFICYETRKYDVCREMV